MNISNDLRIIHIRSQIHSLFKSWWINAIGRSWSHMTTMFHVMSIAIVATVLANCQLQQILNFIIKGMFKVNLKVKMAYFKAPYHVETSLWVFKVAKTIRQKLSGGTGHFDPKFWAPIQVVGPFIGHFDPQSRPFLPDIGQFDWGLCIELTLSWETGTRTVSPELSSFVSTGPSSMFSIW